MQKIREIFLDDIAAFKGNVLAIVLLCGLILVPSLYAWFSLLAFWDPMEATNELKVAIANEDKGYQSDLIPARIEVGSQVVNELRADENYKWIFVDKDKALEGVNSGEYYAAVIIPEDFSSGLLSVFALEPSRPTVEFYINEKVNPISTLLMGESSVDVLIDIDQTFSRTAATITFGTLSNLSNYLDRSGIETYAYNLVDRLDTASTSLSNDAETVRAFSSLLGQTKVLIQTSSDALQRTGSVTDNLDPIIQDTQKMVEETAKTTDASIALADEALAAARTSLANIRNASDAAFTELEDDPADIQGIITSLRGQLAITRNAYQEVLAKLPSESALAPEIQKVIDQLNEMDTTLSNIYNELNQDEVDIRKLHEELIRVFDEAEQALADISASLGDGLKEKINNLAANLGSLETETQSASTQIKDAINTLTNSTGPLIDSLQHTQQALDASANLLSEASASMAHSRDELRDALQNQDLAKVRAIISGNPEDLAKRFTSPVALEKNAVYSVPNFATGISPLYASLVLFVAAILTLVVFKSRLTPERREKLGNPTTVQEFFGHGAFLALVAIAQATMMCTGNVFYLGIQCVSIPLYYLTGIVAGFVFFLLVYSLVFALSNLGRGVAVILLVSQVASTGGELPIQLSAPIFQAICPWLPFTYSMRMFQDSVAGTYGNQYVVSLLCLLAFIIPALIMGLVLQKPFRKLINYIDTQLHEADVL